jgi:hypothetical protein
MRRKMNLTCIVLYISTWLLRFLCNLLRHSEGFYPGDSGRREVRMPYTKCLSLRPHIGKGRMISERSGIALGGLNTTRVTADCLYFVVLSFVNTSRDVTVRIPVLYCEIVPLQTPYRHLKHHVRYGNDGTSNFRSDSRDIGSNVEQIIWMKG